MLVTEGVRTDSTGDSTGDVLCPVIITARRLRRWPLPRPSEGDDKEDRGRVLVVGGAPQMPGAVILAATAALRVGAGKLRIATPRSIAPLVAAAVPEAFVHALPETPSGAIDPAAAEELASSIERSGTAVIGPGLVDEETTGRLMLDLVPRLERATLVVDAAAFAPLADAPDLFHPLGGRVVLTPHAGEAASMLNMKKEAIERDPLPAARRAAADLGAVVALKGARTHIAAPGGKVWINTGGTIGLATSGSGDTLAGLIAGLIARGADPAQATAWGVFVHASAGNLLARKVGQLGFLPRELLAEIPAILHGLENGGRRSKV
jgi:hydroxyethylthiazole kinase-like uncharacterized protein yjeF